MKHIIESKPQTVAAQVKLLTVDENADGQRLDNFLIRHLVGVPKTHVYRIIRSGEVRVNKGRAQAETRLAQGDVVRVPPVRTSERVEQKKERMAQAVVRGQVQGDFPVVWEDESFLAINKPAGVAVHGGSGVSFGVIEQLRMARPQAKFLELVHRIDRETSGLLLIAKKKSALKDLQEQFRGRETGKVYLAAVDGVWPEKLKVLDKSLHKTTVNEGTPSEERRVKVVPKDHPDAMAALSLVKVLATTAARDELPHGASLLEVTIKTGRTHQIRVHLASEGCAILGDDKYGDFALNKALARAQAPLPLRRMFLHAWKLQCKHPLTGEALELQADLDADLAQFVRAAF
ncbi:RluA family pseudouridine synthase [Curvibacter sp. APW13]|uniref:RluA family pseudouridine synthase n=1 Tax=Curvibacter sp. APW13 TaxID=3077236 RepID=UPI0028DDDB7E|nr:RluA family pseudouridine synthase [Curvibacter sp. APW13]MDT8990914.1 RluA family pseudouridine synthase [Curvibacter sp. APW13]